jgi:glycerophosphoryl diester phosphodiesterase
MKIYAHRGASGSEPENTMAAFRRALEVGADGIEMDIHASSDRVPVVIHDRDLKRTTNGSGNVDELSLAELKKLDAGNGERIPTFEEFLELVGDEAHLDVEVKQGGIEREVLAVLARFPKARWAISSFDWDVLRAIRTLSPNAELWLLSTFVNDSLFTAATEIGPTAVSLYSMSYTADNSARLKEAGLSAVIWTVNDVAAAARARDLGAIGLCTDLPAEIIAGLA